MNVLAIVPPFWPPTEGGRQRSYLLLKALARAANVDVFVVDWYGSAAPEARERMRTELNVVHIGQPQARGEYAPWNAARRFAPSVVDRVSHNLGARDPYYSPDPRLAVALAEQLSKKRYDAIVGRYAPITAMAGGFDYAPLLLDVDDLDTQAADARVAQAGNALLKALAWRHARDVRRLVPPLLDRCAHLWLASSADVPLLRRQRAPVSVLPNIPFRTTEECPRLPPSRAESRTMLVVGALHWRPNVEGISHFVERCLPAIRERVPGAHLRIVGGGVSDSTRARWNALPGVETVGFVEDLRAEYAAAAVVVVPVFEGGGTKIKVLEALDHERACVVAEHSHRGYEDTLKHGAALWVGENDAALIEGCATLLADVERRNAMAATGRRVVEEHFRFERLAQVIKAALTSAVSGEKVARRTATGRSAQSIAG